MAASPIQPSGIPISVGIVNRPTDSLEENLIDRLLFAEECAMAANILVDHYVAKYGPGFFPADAAKGQRGAVAHFDMRDFDRLDVEMNYLLKSFIFSAKSSIDKGLHLVYVARGFVQPGQVGSVIPDPLRPKGFGRFINGIFEERFDGLSPFVTGYYRKWADTVIPLRVARNNIKEFGKANFEINLGRPCWKFALSSQNASDPTLRHCAAFQACVDPVKNMTMTVEFIWSVVAGELDHLFMISQILDVGVASHGHVNEVSLGRVRRLLEALGVKIEQYALRLDVLNPQNEP